MARTGAEPANRESVGAGENGPRADRAGESAARQVDGRIKRRWDRAANVERVVQSPGGNRRRVKAGRIRALGVTGRGRSALLPEVPTVSESGLPGFEAVTWFGFEVPRGTPRDVIDRLNREIGKILAMPEVKEKLALQGIDVSGGSPEAFGSYMRDEFAKWGRLVKESGATISD